MVANTGDDFEHLGLAISPDLDTLMYTLAGLDDPDAGWGRRDETWTFMAALAALGGETWFRLGDGDLATHVERTRRLAGGESLSAITADFCRRLGIAARIVPMSDDAVRTRLRTAEGWLDFQDYFVRRRCEPAVTEMAFDGAAAARAASRRARRAARSAAARGRHLPVESVHQHRADPGRSRHARGDRGLPRAGRGGVADHRRTRRQGPDREDDGGARHAGERDRGGAALRATCSTAM